MEKINPRLRAILFDMDGTITRPTLDFDRIRKEIGIPSPLLENMIALEQGETRDRAFSLLEQFEEEAARTSELNRGVRDILQEMKKENIPTGLITRNSRASVETTLTRHNLHFDAIRSREDGPVKPDPAALYAICAELNILPEECLFVGDYRYDIEAGKNAGTRTALLTNGTPPGYLDVIDPDFVLQEFSELKPILDQMTKR